MAEAGEAEFAFDFAAGGFAALGGLGGIGEDVGAGGGHYGGIVGDDDFLAVAEGGFVAAVGVGGDGADAAEGEGFEDFDFSTRAVEDGGDGEIAAGIFGLKVFSKADDGYAGNGGPCGAERSGAPRPMIR